MPRAVPNRRAASSAVGLVLAGGGARGAYEAGALSVLLPVLEARGERPAILIGASAGALNVAFLAANAHLACAEMMASAVGIWESVGWSEVVRPLLSGASLRRAGSYLAETLGVPGARLESLLDSAPLRRTLRERVDFDQLERNAKGGLLRTAGVVATSALTGRSVVFHRGQPSPPTDDRRGIDYVAGPLGEDHVLASAAIPIVFPAVRVSRPARARGWYVDGGTRLNTPLKPAVAFGAQRIVVIALSSPAPGPARLAGAARPDALVGAAQVLLGLLDDQLAADLQTLAHINAIARPARGRPRAAGTAAGTAAVAPGAREIPYILIAPRTRSAIAEIALRVIRARCSGAMNALRVPDLVLLAKLLAADTDAQHAELLSFLLFAPEFTSALITLGRQDARRWLERDELWQVGPL